MADQPENLILPMLRANDTKLDTIMDRLHDLTGRAGSVEDQLVGMRSELSGLRTDFVRLEHRMDRLDERLHRIERRLDLIEA
jgi:predicted  nucleic acid-binding Zn-ribbon protein